VVKKEEVKCTEIFPFKLSSLVLHSKSNNLNRINVRLELTEVHTKQDKLCRFTNTKDFFILADRGISRNH
jgi:hypothetical protein